MDTESNERGRTTMVDRMRRPATVAALVAALVMIAAPAHAERTVLARSADDSTWILVDRDGAPNVRIAVHRQDLEWVLEQDGSSFLYADCGNRVVTPAQHFAMHLVGGPLEYRLPDDSADGYYGHARSDGVWVPVTAGRLGVGDFNRWMRGYAKRNGCTVAVH